MSGVRGCAGGGLFQTFGNQNGKICVWRGCGGDSTTQVYWLILPIILTNITVQYKSIFK